jgi:hypothetical protein
MTALFPALLFLHLLGVVAGIGPTFAFSRITATGRGEPVPGYFTTKVVRAITTSLTIPLAALVLVTGIAKLLILGYDVFATPWLLASIVVFLASFGYATTVQNRDLARIIDLASLTPPLLPRLVEELARRRRRVRNGGLFMRLGAATILFLMVVKPS